MEGFLLVLGYLSSTYRRRHSHGKRTTSLLEKLNTHGGRAVGFGDAGSKDTKDLGCAFAPDRCMPIHRASDRRCVRSFHYFLLALVKYLQ